MARTESFLLGDHFSAFIDGKVAEGRYASASEVVHAGLRLLEAQETGLGILRAALIAGEDSGSPTPFDFDDFLVRKRQGDTAEP